MNSPLFPGADVRRHWDDVLTRDLQTAHQRIQDGPTTPNMDVVTFRSQLASFDFGMPRLADDVLPWVITQLEHGIVHVNHRRYFGLYNPAPTAPAQWADRIIATFNPQLATWTTSPVAVEIEAHVIRAVAARAGLPEGTFGHFTTGGAEANYTALLCALTRACPRFSTEGARAFGGPPVFYSSRDSHLAWLKIAHQAGVGRAAVRLVTTDGSGRMDPDALAAAIQADRAGGRVPVMVVATAGTTNAGMIDPLAATAQLARHAGIWFHVDAAWGGAVIASEKLRYLLAGVENADSVTVDAHKWFATTMGCGMFLIRNPSILPEVFEVSASYMPSNTRSVGPYVTSLQWSRRFLGLRLFLSLAIAGWGGYADHVEHAVDLAATLKERLHARNWRVVNNSSLAVLCIEPPPKAGTVRRVVANVLASGLAWVSVATFEGREVVRACITSGEATLDDISKLVKTLLANESAAS